MATVDRGTQPIEAEGIEKTPSLTVTPLAAQTVKRLLEEKQITDHGLRVFVAGSNCAGLQYGMAFENSPQPFDQVFEVEGIRIIVDPMSLQLIHGATIDYVDDPTMGGGFRIDNPNAVASCGCGPSSRTAGSGEAPGRASGGGCACY